MTSQDCYQEHQYWHQIIRHQQEEIQQLRALLLEVINQVDYKSLRRDAVDYCQELNQLQAKITRLDSSLICNGAGCKPTDTTPPCNHSLFGIGAVISLSASAFSADLLRIKNGCLQFLSSLMSLNLL